MSKDVIQQKNVKVREQLYNEILNGFQYDGGSFEKTARVTNVQIQRIRQVAKIWSDNQKFFSFYQDIAKLIKPYKNELINLSNEDENEDDEEDDDEGTDEDFKNNNNGLLKILDTVHKAKRIWLGLNTAYSTIKIAKEVVEDYKKGNEGGKKKIRTDLIGLIVGTLGNFLDNVFGNVATVISGLILKMFDSPKVNLLFTKMKEKTDEIETYVNAKITAYAGDKIPVIGGAFGNLVDVYYSGKRGISAALDGNWSKATRHLSKASTSASLAALNFIDKTKMGGKAAGKIGKAAITNVLKKTAKFSRYAKAAANAKMWAEMGVDMVEITKEFEDLIDWTEDDQVQVRKWINDSVVEPILKPAATNIERDLYNLSDVYANGVQNLVQQFEAVTNDIMAANTNNFGFKNKDDETESPILEDLKKIEIEDTILPPRVTFFDRKLRVKRKGKKDTTVDLSKIKWQEDELTNLMRNSLQNRFNAQFSGNTSTESKESRSIKVLTATFVYLETVFNKYVVEVFDGMKNFRESRTNRGRDNEFKNRIQMLEAFEEKMLNDYDYSKLSDKEKDIIEKMSKQVEQHQSKKVAKGWTTVFANEDRIWYPTIFANGAVNGLFLDIWLSTSGASYTKPFEDGLDFTTPQVGSSKKYDVVHYGRGTKSYSAYYDFMSGLFDGDKGLQIRRESVWTPEAINLAVKKNQTFEEACEEDEFFRYKSLWSSTGVQYREGGLRGLENTESVFEVEINKRVDEIIKIVLEQM